MSICAEIDGKNIIINALLSKDGTPERQSVFILKNVKLIPLTGKNGKGKFAMVDDDDYEHLMKRKWNIADNCYAVSAARKHDKKRQPFSMHRVIMGCTKGDGKIIDHIDGNPLNNQKSNLRFCTSSENCVNSKKRGGVSKYFGVFPVKRADGRIWIAKISINKKQKTIGYFNHEINAAIAYNNYIKEMNCTFHRINEIPKNYKPEKEIKKLSVIEKALIFISLFVRENSKYPKMEDFRQAFNITKVVAYSRLNNIKILEYKATLPKNIFTK